MNLFVLVAVAAFLNISFSSASPFLEESRDLVCLVHRVLINLITLNHGEEFCSAYLGIQTSTTRTTTTEQFTITQVLPASTLTTTVVTGTETSTLTSLVTSLVTATSTIDTVETSFTTETRTVTSTTTLAPARKRRSQEIPPYLAAYEASKISQACSCLNLPTRTTLVVTASQTNTVASTPPPVTSQVSTITVITITTTDINTITSIQTLTNTISTIATITSSTTITITTTPPPAATRACDNPQIRLTTYDFDCSRPFFSWISASTLDECCDMCWSLDDCLTFQWDGSRSSAPDVFGECFVFGSAFPATDPIPNPPARCPLGVENTELLQETPGGIYGVGPCDLAGTALA